MPTTRSTTAKGAKPNKHPKMPDFFQPRPTPAPDPSTPPRKPSSLATKRPPKSPEIGELSPNRSPRKKSKAKSTPSQQSEPSTSPPHSPPVPSKSYASAVSAGLLSPLTQWSDHSESASEAEFEDDSKPAAKTSKAVSSKDDHTSSEEKIIELGSSSTSSSDSDSESSGSTSNGNSSSSSEDLSVLLKSPFQPKLRIHESEEDSDETNEEEDVTDNEVESQDEDSTDDDEEMDEDDSTNFPRETLDDHIEAEAEAEAETTAEEQKHEEQRNSSTEEGTPLAIAHVQDEDMVEAVAMASVQRRHARGQTRRTTNDNHTTSATNPTSTTRNGNTNPEARPDEELQRPATYASAAATPPTALRPHGRGVRWSNESVNTAGVDPDIRLIARRMRMTVVTEEPDNAGDMLRLILIRIQDLFSHIKRHIHPHVVNGQRKKYVWIRQFSDITDPVIQDRGVKQWQDGINPRWAYVYFKKYFNGALYENTRVRSGKWFFRFTLIVGEDTNVDELVSNVNFGLTNQNEKLQDLTTAQDIFDPKRIGFLFRSNRQLAYDCDLLTATNAALVGGVRAGFHWATITKTAPGQPWNRDKAVYAIVVETNNQQLEAATTQLRDNIFPLAYDGHEPLLGTNLTFCYLDSHPHVANNPAAIVNIGTLINRQKMHLAHEKLISCTAFLPFTLFDRIPSMNKTMHKLLMGTTSTTTPSGIGGKLWHSITSSNWQGNYTVHFTFHEEFKIESESIVGSLPLFLRDELQIPERELMEFFPEYAFPEGDSWKVDCRSVNNSATRFIDRMLEGSEDLVGTAQGNDTQPSTFNANQETNRSPMTDRERREFERTIGLRDAETVVDHTTRERREHVAPPLEATEQFQSLDINTDDQSVASTIGHQSTTGRSQATSVVSSGTRARIDNQQAQIEHLESGMTQVLRLLQTMAEQDYVNTHPNFTGARPNNGGEIQEDDASQSASGGHPGRPP